MNTIICLFNNVPWLTSDTVEGWLLCPTVSNLNTAKYQLGCCLAKILFPLNRSQYFVKSSNKFVNINRQHVTLSSYKLVSFDVKFLLTNVKRIYPKHEIATNIGRKNSKYLITLHKKVSCLLLMMRYTNKETA